MNIYAFYLATQREEAGAGMMYFQRSWSKNKGVKYSPKNA
jgi:hypothetical protein